MTNQKPKIVLTNDDGFDAPGLQTLYEAIKDDYNVLIVAPLEEQSGKGCGFSHSRSYFLEERHRDGRLIGYAVDGTPVDCVKSAHHIVTNFKADLVLSGINNGGNFGNSVWYSGTVAATIEAAMLGYRAVAVSMWNHGVEGRRFDVSAEYTKSLLPWFLSQTHMPRTLWNLNVPNDDPKNIKGVRFTETGNSFYDDTFEVVLEEDNRRHFHNRGMNLIRPEERETSDDFALACGYASLSLLQLNTSLSLPSPIAEALETELNKRLGKEMK